MSNASSEPPMSTQAIIARRIRKATKHAITTLGYVPEEKLDYRPTESANSCRTLALHIVQGNCFVLKSLSIEPNGNPSVTHLETLICGIGDTGEQIAEFADGADDGAMAGSVDFFGGQFPFPDLLLTAEWHISRHTGQIDYLETTWGDLENHQ